MNRNKLSKGVGPDALPPNIFSLAPAGLTRDKSHLGISPAHSKANSLRKAFAHPSLLSLTIIVSSVSNNNPGTSGNLFMQSRSTEKPTPVPHISIYIASSNAFGSSTGK